MVLIHAGLFTRSQRGASAIAILRVAPLNLAAALAILAAGLAGGSARWVLWGAAVAVILVPSLRPPDPRFELAPGHFVERHGLVVIVALGESVVAAGIGARGHRLTVGLIVAALLGLALSACLWWTSFGRDEDARALGAMSRASRADRARLAVRAFYHWYLLGIGSQRWRILAALLALASVPVGHAASAVAQLGILVAALLVTLTAEVRVPDRAQDAGDSPVAER